MEIRQATLADFEIVNELNGYCYGYSPEANKELHQKHFEHTHKEQYCIEQNNTVIGNARCIPFEQNIRGCWKKMGGIAMVVSAPEVRRRGNIRQLMLFLFKKMHESKMGVSTLYPFKDTFYSSFGYVSGPATVQVEINPKQFKRWRKLPHGYSIERFPFNEGLNFFKNIHEKAIQEIHGGVRRSEQRWNEFLITRKDWLAVVFNASSEPEGVIQYQSKGFGSNFPWAEEGKIAIRENYTLTPEARHTIYHYLFLHADQINKVILPINPNYSSPNPWLQDFYTSSLQTGVIVMDRIIDVQSSLQDLPIEKEGQLVINVIDNFCPWNNREFELKGKNSQLKVSLVEAQNSSLEITIEGLTSLVYGLLSVNDLQTFQWIKGLSKSQRKLLAQWFPLKEPWMMEAF
ncbi:MAG: GNAT family N-acetyltransferase [Candidatus Heimdallarchaeota archaeon]|nr:GNAT family N-acetyltransferase [Candidatus Heimdallarchaeota archaeon]